MSNISDHFAGKAVLLTGATGLVGRVFVEKVLRDLPDVRRLFLLIRPKAGRAGRTLSVEERLGGDFLGSSVFDALREIHGDGFLPLVREKIVAVEGDLGQERLGLDDATYRRLQEELHVIVNCAAVVTFDAPLDQALSLNALGPLRLLELAKGCRNPVTFAHVSTCYVNGSRQGVVAEEPLDPHRAMSETNGTGPHPYDVDEEVLALQSLVETVERRSRRGWRSAVFRRSAKGQKNHRDAGGADRLRRQWVERRLSALGMRWARSRGWNDTYTFTKAMGEQLLVRHRGDVPTLILRPSIVESALNPPIQGWLDGMRMVDPLIVAYGRNLLPDFPGNPNAILDIIPVDLVINALLAAIPQASQGQAPLVYQVASGTENPISLGGFADAAQDYFLENSLTGRGNPVGGLPRLTWPSPQRFLRRLRYRYLLPIRSIEVLTAGAAWVPGVRSLRGTLRSRRSGLERLRYYATILTPYSTVRCQYLTQNTRRLWESLDSEDSRRFNFDVTAIDWPHYVQEVHIPGLKRYVLGVTPRPASDRRPRGVPAPSPVPAAPQSLDVEEAAGPFHEEAVAPAIPPTNGAGNGSARRFMAVSGSHGKQTSEFWMGATLPGTICRTLTRCAFGVSIRLYLGITCEGLEHVPRTGAFIVAGNHNSHVDTAALLALLGKGGRPIHPVAARDYFFRTPLLSWASRMFLGAVPFDRQSQAVESLGLAIELLRRRHSLIYFPEGGRSEDGKLRSFKRGIGVLALESGAPVVPVRIEGSFKVLPKGRFFPRPHHIRVRFAPPISVEAYGKSGEAPSPQELIRRVSEDTRQAVETLA